MNFVTCASSVSLGTSNAFCLHQIAFQKSDNACQLRCRAPSCIPRPPASPTLPEKAIEQRTSFGQVQGHHARTEYQLRSPPRPTGGAAPPWPTPRLEAATSARQTSCLAAARSRSCRSLAIALGLHWTALLGLEQGVKVRHTTTSWIVHVETLYGRSPGELVTLAKNLADRVAKGLMSKYGCVLGDGQINKRHELGVDDPVANLLNRYFTVSTPKRVIDDSPGEDEGELDHVGRDAAVEYLLMPERVKKLEGQVDNVLTDLAKISGSLEKLEKMGCSLAKVAEALGKLVDFQSNQEIPKSLGGKEYIA